MHWMPLHYPRQQAVKKGPYTAPLVGRRHIRLWGRPASEEKGLGRLSHGVPDSASWRLESGAQDRPVPFPPLSM